MKNFYICTHLVLIFFLITLTILLINSALSLADSVENVDLKSENLHNLFKEEDNQFTVLSPQSSNLNTLNHHSSKETGSYTPSEDEQLLNWDNAYDSSAIYKNNEFNSNENFKNQLNKTNQEKTKFNKCNREIGNLTVRNKTLGDNGFKIKITGNPEKYTPGELYTVGLMGHDTNYMTQKFIGFMLLVEPKDPSINNNVGQFQLYGDALTKVSDTCPTAVIHTSTIPKHEIQVMWQAPKTGSGCVAFRATIIESTNTFYMDDGSLTRHICEQETESLDEQPEILNECCACDEAKFEMIFEGLWSKYTHPKEFPPQEGLTHFSEVIGASHASTFRMWEYGGYASEGLRQVAELGVTKKLESELKSESDKIRTIIKARGLWHPNLNGKTFAVFRVDKQHHLMSLVSMLGPSPDWIVGVSALELCLKNCSWVNEKQMNLYLWDAGTDSGVTYLSPNQPTIPQDRIKRITPSNPSSSDSPFYDSTTNRMRPFARLTVTRQRLYEKSCSDLPYEPQSPNRPEQEVNQKSNISSFSTFNADENSCSTTDWTEWSECSANCGEGYRLKTRNFISESLARSANCNTSLTEKMKCNTFCKDGLSCAVTSWGEWSKCSDVCGKGHRTRSRRFVYSGSAKICSDLVQLVEKEVCLGPGLNSNQSTLNECEKPKENSFNNSGFQDCAVTQWSEWSPCTVTCGKGVKIRTRLYMFPTSHKKCDVELIQRTPCVASKQQCSPNANEAREICLMPKESGPCRGYFPRWYYDQQIGMCKQFYYGGCEGNKNNFERFSQCKKQCEIIFKEFVNAPLPKSVIAFSYALKNTTIHLEKGLVCAPISTLTTYQSNSISKIINEGETSTLASVSKIDKNSQQNYSIIDCEVSGWSEWSPCSCDPQNPKKERKRKIKVHPQNGGKPCPKKLIQRRKCKNKNVSYSSHNCLEKHKNQKQWSKKKQSNNKNKNPTRIKCLINYC